MPNISSGITSSNFIVAKGVTYNVLDGGVATCAEIRSGGSMEVSSGGLVSDSPINDGGSLTALDGARLIGLKVLAGGSLEIFEEASASGCQAASGGIINGFRLAEDVEYSAGMHYSGALAVGRAHLYDGQAAQNVQVVSGGSMTVNRGAAAKGVAIQSGGKFVVSKGGAVSGVQCLDDSVSLAISIDASTTIEDLSIRGKSYSVQNGLLDGFVLATDGNAATQEAVVSSGGILANATINAGGQVVCQAGGAVHGVTLGSGAYMVINSGGSLGGHIDIDSDIQGLKVTQGAVIDFTMAEMPDDGALITNFLKISGASQASYTMTFTGELKNGTYLLADRTQAFSNVITVLGEDRSGRVAISRGQTLYWDDKMLEISDDGIVLQAEVSVSECDVHGDADGVSWQGVIPEASSPLFNVSLWENSGSGAIRITTAGSGIDFFNTASGEYSWMASSNNIFAQSTDFTVEAGDAPILWRSSSNDNSDAFFAAPTSTWGSDFLARNVAAPGAGLIELEGKNRIMDVFEGSKDANVLYLTDDANGDALFLDDIYSDTPQEANPQKRLDTIDEIRCGRGDDIVDLTSFAPTGQMPGIIVRGGVGNDVIWTADGDNRLFGDAGADTIYGGKGNDVIAGGAGDDSLHGGGGDDIFCFCQNWGHDSVIQSADGTVTLWFAEGITGTWDGEGGVFTSSDGNHTVTVSSDIAAVTLKFGAKETGYPALAETGAFQAETTRFVFETTFKNQIIAAL